MDPKIKEALDALRAELGKNVEAIARVDAIEKSAKETGAKLDVFKGELETIRAENKTREDAIKDLQQKSRSAALVKDPIHDAREALRMLGMMGRQLIARAKGLEIPADFKDEADLVRDYQAKRASLSATAASGSYLVPSITEANLIDTLEEISDLLNRVDFIPGLPAAGTITIPTLTTRPTLQFARATTDTKMTQSDAAFSYMTVSPAEAYLIFGVDNKLLTMSAIALGSLLNNLLRDSIIEGIVNALVSGDGTSTYNSITGILKEATYVTSMPSGKKAFSDLAKSDLTSLKSAVLKRGRARGVFLMSNDVLGIIEDMDRTGKIPVITYGQDGTPRIMQNPVVIDEGMPDLADTAAATGILGFGDLAAYLVGLVGGIQIASSQDARFEYNQTCFRGLVNMDIKRKPVNIFRLLKTAV
jgi:HK97 family phage major capsid protein